MGKLIFFLLAVAILYYLFKNDKSVEKVGEGEAPPPPEGEDMVLDPQCKTYISKLEAFRVREGDKIHYFCSPECRDKFVARLKG